MWEMLAAVIGLLLAVYGAADLIVRLCWHIVFKADGAENTLLVCVPEGEDAEYRIRRLAAWRRLCPAGGFEITVVLAKENEQLHCLCRELGLASRSNQPQTRF